MNSCFQRPKQRFVATPANPGGDPTRWRERLCFYTSVRPFGSHTVPVFGPFPHHREAMSHIEGFVFCAFLESYWSAMHHDYGTMALVDGEFEPVTNDVIGYIPPLRAEPLEPWLMEAARHAVGKNQSFLR